MQSGWVRWLFLMCLALALQCAARADDAAAAAAIPFRIAVVNVAELLDKAPQAKAASAKLKTDFSSREKALDTEQQALQQFEASLEKQADAVTEDQKIQQQRDLRSRQRTYTRALEDFREEVRTARDLAVENVQNQIFKAIEEVRAREQIDVVLKESDYVAASQRVNMTDTVLHYLEQKFTDAGGNAAALPPKPDAVKK